MDSGLRVTDIPAESNFADLVSGDAVWAIPLFQRPYSWAAKELEQLQDDIDAIRDEVAASVFLGVIVSYSRGSVPGRPVIWDVVDGQQRLTTLYLLIMAAVDVAANNENAEWASAAIGSYLLVRPMAGNPINTKLIPSYADRAQFATLWARIKGNKSLDSRTEFKVNLPMPPSPSGQTKGNVTKQFDRLRKEMSRIFEEGGIENLKQYVEIVTRRMSVVSIPLKDPAVAPKIFERLNARALPVTIADLVRNEVFSRSNDDPIQSQHVFTTYWEPFIAKFTDVGADFEKFLFPYGLVLNPNIKKAELFVKLREHWGQVPNPEEIIRELDLYSGYYITAEKGIPSQQISSEIAGSLLRFYRVGHPSTMYSFVIQAAHACESKEISFENFDSLIIAIESFLFRRAIAGIESTGLHAGFKGLWKEMITNYPAKEINGTTLRTLISKRQAISWPGDEEFENSIRTEELYLRKNIKQFALREFEISRVGESPKDEFQIEHILPQEPTEYWKKKFEDKYKSYIHTWANLIPISEVMNPSIGQQSFDKKREAYRDSKFATTREITSLYNDWNLEQWGKRADSIVVWALKRWPY